jgi:hypothetical protein
MTRTQEVEAVTPGYQFRVLLGCDTRDGEVIEATADTVEVGWAPTESRARQKAREVTADV